MIVLFQIRRAGTRMAASQTKVCSLRSGKIFFAFFHQNLLSQISEDLFFDFRSFLIKKIFSNSLIQFFFCLSRRNLMVMILPIINQRMIRSRNPCVITVFRSFLMLPFQPLVCCLRCLKPPLCFGCHCFHLSFNT